LLGRAGPDGIKQALQYSTDINYYLCHP
jgi:hypothetical protein